MALDRIQLTQFRNHPSTSISATAKFNLLTGENGAGKTNVLEAISLFAPGRGLRRAALPEMTRQNGGNSFTISAELMAADGPVQLGTGNHPERPGRRLVQINGAEASAAALGEWLAISWLTPAMDRLFVDSASGRRRFVDRMVLALEPSHARNVSRLEASLRERNRLLADVGEPDAIWLDALEAQIAEAGALVAGARARLIAALTTALGMQPAAPFARPQLSYQAGGPSETDALYRALSANRKLDRAAGRSLLGPHRDDLVVIMAGKAQPAAHCSTGEQKAMLISLILAHASLLHSNRPALLLLDEVAAHLDPLRRAALFERLTEGQAQIWMTGTELDPFSALQSNAVHWRIDQGSVLASS